jgi:hypothetical protein
MRGEIRRAAARSGRALRACLIALLALEIGTGCAYLPKFGDEPVPPGFERIVLHSQVEKTNAGKLEGDTHSDSAVKGLTIGFVGGGVTGGGVGFGVGLITCVPTAFFYPICLIIATGFGVIIGSVAGTFTGASMGLPWKSTTRINQALDRVQREGDFSAEFRSAVQAAIPVEQQVGRDSAEATVTARLDSVDLRQHLRQRLSMRMHASLVQEWRSNGGEPQTRTCEYVYTSPTMDVEDWLLHDGQLFVDTFATGMGSFARWMARDLEAFSTRRAQPKTASAPATCFQIQG